jgi:outer membrane protein assembly factor BamB
MNANAYTRRKFFTKSIDRRFWFIDLPARIAKVARVILRIVRTFVSACSLVLFSSSLVHAANPGDELWSAQLYDQGEVSLLGIAPDGTIYVSRQGRPAYDGEGSLQAWSPAGLKKWEQPFSLHSAVIGSDGTIYGRTMTNYPGGIFFNDAWPIVAITPEGQIKWTYGNLYRPYPPVSSALAADGKLFVAGHSYLDRTVALNPADGTVTSNFFSVGFETLGFAPNGTLEEPGSSGPGWEPNNFMPRGGAIAISSDGTIYLPTSEYDPRPSVTYLYAFNSDHTLKWRSAPFSGYGSAVIGPDGTVYCKRWGGEFGHCELVAFSPAGTEKWHFTFYDTGVRILEAPPAIASDGTVYFISGDEAKLYSLNPDGSQAWVGRSLTSESSCWQAGWNETRTEIVYTPCADAVPRYGFPHSGPLIGADGTVYVVEQHVIRTNYLYGESWTSISAKLHAFKGSAPPSKIGWPMVGHDAQHTGRAVSLQPAFRPLSRPGNDFVRLQFATLASVRYVLESKNDLAENNWTPIETIIGTGNIHTKDESLRSDQGQRFYRLRVEY